MVWPFDIVIFSVHVRLGVVPGHCAVPSNQTSVTESTVTDFLSLHELSPKLLGVIALATTSIDFW